MMIEAGRLALAQRVLEIEAQAIDALRVRIGQDFLRAVDTILHCRGRVVVSGMGKSGHVARKIASTFASTGTPSFFVHPGEASHGDLGMITSDDVLLALSNSGESNEIIAILPIVKRRGAVVIAMTGNPASTMAKEADIHLDSSVAQEACPLGLAPTASTTTALALGDALAVVLLDARGFGADDFARTHPGGALGRRLLIHVSDVMRPLDNVARLAPTVTIADALLEISGKGLGMTAVVDDDNKVLGIFTDGDLRRVFGRAVDIHATTIGSVMTHHPQTIAPGRLATEAVSVMEAHKVAVLLVTDAEGRLLGALNVHDLLRAGVM